MKHDAMWLWPKIKDDNFLYLSKIIFCFLLQIFTRRFGGWGWDWKNRKHTRPVRSKYWGCKGGVIFQILCEKGLITDQRIKWNIPFKPYEEKIKNFLIWGYFEKDRIFL